MKITKSSPDGIAGLISRAATAPASGISVVDAANNFVGTNLETILTEIGTTLTEEGMVPYFIAAGDTFRVPLYKQALFEMTIEVEPTGILEVNGYLIMVT